MDIYIKPKQKASIIGRKLVYLKDIADVYTEADFKEELKNLTLLKKKEDDNSPSLLSIIDVIKTINSKYPGNTIVNVGEKDTVVEFQKHAVPTKGPALFFKIGIIFLILMIGSATAIMSFHTDAQVPAILETYYYIFFRERISDPKLITIPYSIGLASGIIIFFNHFSKIKLSNDPTPIEVQTTTYEKETVANLVDNLEKKGKEEG